MSTTPRIISSTQFLDDRGPTMSLFDRARLVAALHELVEFSQGIESSTIATGEASSMSLAAASSGAANVRRAQAALVVRGHRRHREDPIDLLGVGGSLILRGARAGVAAHKLTARTGTPSCPGGPGRAARRVPSLEGRRQHRSIM